MYMFPVSIPEQLNLLTAMCSFKGSFKSIYRAFLYIDPELTRKEYKTHIIKQEWPVKSSYAEIPATSATRMYGHID